MSDTSQRTGRGGQEVPDSGPGNDATASHGGTVDRSVGPGAEVAGLAEPDPLRDPGLEPHVPRPTDVDERAEKRAERQIATCFILSAICALLFCVAYFVFQVGDEPDVILGYGASNVTLGLTLGLALLLIGAGVALLLVGRRRGTRGGDDARD